jgi:hypothetical protein
MATRAATVCSTTTVVTLVTIAVEAGPLTKLAWVVSTVRGSLTDMKSLVGAFMAIMAINSAPGLSAATATYLTVLAALLAAVIYVAVRRRRQRSVLVSPPPAAAAAGPTIVQHIYTTQPVFTGVYQPGASTPLPVHVHSERVGQVFLPDSVYRRPAK